MTRRTLTAIALVLILLASPQLVARQPDPDISRLEAQLQQLDADPVLAQAGGLERLQARQALLALATARSKDRASALRIAEWRVEIARLAAETAPLTEQSRGLDSERDAILLEASRRDAERARREAEMFRLRTLAREEEAERNAETSRRQSEQAAAAAAAAALETEQARQLAEARALEADLARQEAELAAQMMAESAPTTSVLLDRQERAGKTVYVLAGSAFASGKASLSPAARDALGKLAKELKAQKSRVRIAGHTDSQGNDAANQALSLQRAQAVRAALQRWGIAASRLQAAGRGESEPVAGNDNPAGRARNRRVEITLE